MNIKNWLDRKMEPVRIHYEDENAVQMISKQLVSLMPKQNRPIVCICIGTDRSTGDSLGPLVGTLLKEKQLSSFHVLGTLDDPVHAVNLQEKLYKVRNTFENPFIIGIDACLGRLKSIGCIEIDLGPVKPGAGVQKDLPSVGDAHLTGIVNVSGFMEFFVLQNTRLNLVMKMAKIMSQGILEASYLYPAKKSFYTFELNEGKQLP
jgi:putative sporulation protein YyaC